MAKAKAVANLNVQAPTSTEAGIIAKTRLDEMYSWSQYVDEPYRSRELHNLRIAAKRLRYTLEVFSEFLPEESHAVIKEVEQMQEELGEFHDYAVMLALLRLCLGSQDSGSGYTDVLSHAAEQQRDETFVLDPDMVAYVLTSAASPSPVQRQGLEQLLLLIEKQRDACYQSFRQHWYQLQERDFRHEVLALVDK